MSERLRTVQSGGVRRLGLLMAVLTVIGALGILPATGSPVGIFLALVAILLSMTALVFVRVAQPLDD